jgi:hypothetical protein
MTRNFVALFRWFLAIVRDANLNFPLATAPERSAARDFPHCLGLDGKTATVRSVRAVKFIGLEHRKPTG